MSTDKRIVSLMDGLMRDVVKDQIETSNMLLYMLRPHTPPKPLTRLQRLKRYPKTQLDRLRIGIIHKLGGYDELESDW